MTLYSGIDPNEKSRLLIRSIVKVPVADAKKKEDEFIWCLEEATITRNFSQPQPMVQIQLRKLPDDFGPDSQSKDKISELRNALGYSLFYMNPGKNRVGFNSQGLGQVG